MTTLNDQLSIVAFESIVKKLINDSVKIFFILDINPNEINESPLYLIPKLNLQKLKPKKKLTLINFNASILIYSNGWFQSYFDKLISNKIDIQILSTTSTVLLYNYLKNNNNNMNQELFSKIQIEILKLFNIKTISENGKKELTAIGLYSQDSENNDLFLILNELLKFDGFTNSES